jgi:hypothetical protein
MQPQVTFKLGKGGLGRPLAGFDHYSTLIGYYSQASVNSAYANIGNKQYTSLQDAENDGVVNTCAEATASNSLQTVTTVGVNGDTLAINFTNFNGLIVNIGNYTKSATETTVVQIATSIVASINALTYITGFSATVGAGGAYTIVAPKTLGVFPNAKSVVNTIIGTLAITNVAFSGGTRSYLAIFNYQIAEFFRANPLGILYFSLRLDAIANATSAFNSQMISDISIVANAWGGKARQIAIWAGARVFDSTMLTAMKSAKVTLFNNYIPAEISLTADNTATALGAQFNLRTLTADGCTFIASQSTSGVGFMLSRTQQQVISCLGLNLGILSECSPSQSYAEVGAFSLSDGVECETVSFLDGTDFTAISTSLANQLHDYGFVFMKKFANFTGTYFNSDNCAISEASDYAYVVTNRTINKAVRNVYASILPLLNSRVTLNSDGTLSEQAIASFSSQAGYPLTQMFIDGDLSQDPSVNGGITVSRTEVVSSTSNIPITIRLIPIGIARQITITIGFVKSI